MISGLKERGYFFERIDRIKVNAFNQPVIGYDNIFAIGDIAILQTDQYPNGHLKWLNQLFSKEIYYVGENLVRLQKNETFVPFEYYDKGLWQLLVEIKQ